MDITELGARGDGIGMVGGERVFVPFAMTGDRVRVTLEPGRSEGRRGDLLALLHPSQHRAVPACPYFGRCGGCTLQHLAEPAYGDWKRDQVVAAVIRAGFEAGAAVVAPLVRVRPHSRRRARLAAVRIGGRIRLGFQERLSHRIVPVDQCPVLVPVLADLLPAWRTVLGDVLAEGDGADAAVTATATGVDLLLIGPRTLTLAAREALASFAEAADLARLSWQGDDRSEPEPLAARRPVRVRAGPVEVPLPPGGFLQPTAAGEAALVAAVSAAVGGAGRVADLYAGLGTFALPLAAGGSAVHAVEGDQAAVAALRQAYGAPQGVTVECRDLSRSPLAPADLARFEAVVFDPPRTGAAAQAAALAASSVPTVVAVSCNPATWARDAGLLKAGGYRLESVLPVDQFLWSAHVELAAVFRKA